MDGITQLDGAILLWMQETLRPLLPWEGFWCVFTALGNAGILWIVASLILLIPKRTRRWGVAGLLTLGLCALATNLCIKPLVARPRPFTVFPDLVPLIAKPTDFSFPSGHTAAGFAFGFAMLWGAPNWLRFPALGLACMMAFSRLFVGVHYPSDVLGGILIGLLSSLVIFLLLHLFYDRLYAKAKQRFRFL